MSSTTGSALSVLELGDMALTFGRVDRITYHQDGVTLESDTDHTVMLGLIGCAFAQRYLKHLDLGLIAQYALIHDLVEVYAGDTPTLKINDDIRQQKKQRELKSAVHITDKFINTLPWVPVMISRYERLVDDESRYLKALDKLLPKITHILNSGVTLREQGMTRQMLVDRYAEQLEELESILTLSGNNESFTVLFKLRAELISMLMNNLDSVGGWPE